MSGRWTEEDLQRHLSKTARTVAAEPRSKFRNVKVRVDGFLFDSKHEAQTWAELKLREKAGEIQQLQRQVTYPLVTVNAAGEHLVFAEFRADFCWLEEGRLVVADAKGHLTKEYKLKRKAFALQYGFEIVELYRNGAR